MGSTEELIMGTVCGSTSFSTYSTTTRMYDPYDHRDHDHHDHMNHIDHKDHTMPRIYGNSAGSVKTEIATMMLLTCLSKALVWGATIGKIGENKTSRIKDKNKIKSKCR